MFYKTLIATLIAGSAQAGGHIDLSDADDTTCRFEDINGEATTDYVTASPLN